VTGRANIAFYAPMKSPDDPVPSGDRTMARLLRKALIKAGFSVTVPTHFRSFDGGGNMERQVQLKKTGLDEAERLIRQFGDMPLTERPKVWVSYHVYYKSPDWIGPQVCKALGIPYLVVEGSRAAKRADGPWATGHDGAEQALDQASVIFAMTGKDSVALVRHKPPGQRIIQLPPFLDLDEWPDIRSPEKRFRTASLSFLTVAMMRHGDKLESYRQLAGILGMVSGPWQLDIIGDGPARTEIKHLFAPFADAVRFHGAVADKMQLAHFYAEADIFLWPAVKEAYGMVFLEAQAFGCPVIAGNHGGVGSVVKTGETGILVPADDIRTFADTIATLEADRNLLQHLSVGARTFVRETRNLDRAAELLRNTIDSLTGSRQA